ncbi:protein mono-ADP-ribosyltransferase PARP14-like [Xenia sp. Carnegie-2017]|uniref:protein mono-ADP-ribosyltransferase PARP14-like n=1 Tax=Xenia sp. Carnegie-2017 TaxID=2897299 RepID=UPI001F046EA7|nr:protein mono-ADP-ribosyltransferase PARP14-like [Xenia sp. Carnegie-2017]
MGRSDQKMLFAFQKIDEFINHNIITKKVDHKNLYDVLLKYASELKKIATDARIRMDCENEQTISLTGLNSNVIQTSTILKDFICKFTEDEKRLKQLTYLSENVQWSYQDVHNKVIHYNKELSSILEIARMHGEQTVELTESEGQVFNVDFSQMKATSRRTGKTKTLLRKIIGFNSVPSSWLPQPSDQVVNLVGLTRSSAEYIEIKDYFVARGGRSDQIYEIHRIQNPRLYSRYQAFKSSMCGDVNEMRLFHGTNPNNVRSINSNNFSRSFAGVNAVKYGNGVYFARDASYSLRYSLHQCSGSQPKMYIAKVLVGEYTLGKEGLKEPPSRNDLGNPGLLYDSVVDSPSNPKIFVIFQDNQSYPEYLITLNKQ